MLLGFADVVVSSDVTHGHADSDAHQCSIPPRPLPATTCPHATVQMLTPATLTSLGLTRKGLCIQIAASTARALLLATRLSSI